MFLFSMSRFPDISIIDGNELVAAVACRDLSRVGSRLERDV